MAYMNVVDGKYMMKGGVRDTLFGLIGTTTGGESHVKSLGGLVEHKADGKVPTGLKKEKVADKTERHIGGKNATAIPGAHTGQVPYPGVYMKAVGKKL
jgi:hypothetical protein